MGGAVWDDKNKITVGLTAVTLLCVGFWWLSSDLMARWAGVPPVPSTRTASLMALNDTQFAYRSGAMTLQTLGDTGGQIVPLKEYNYVRLSDWFQTLHRLDPAADHVPMIAAYYFGATSVPGDIAYIVDYLEQVGDSPVGQKWRWLAHAAYLARHRMDDMPRALDIAYKLSRITPLDGRPLPIWARQMPAFVLAARGDQAAARALLENMLINETDLHPNEVNFMQGYLAEQLNVPPAEVEQLMRLRGGPTQNQP